MSRKNLIFKLVTICFVFLTGCHPESYILPPNVCPSLADRFNSKQNMQISCIVVQGNKEEDKARCVSYKYSVFTSNFDDFFFKFLDVANRLDHGEQNLTIPAIQAPNCGVFCRDMHKTIHSILGSTSKFKYQKLNNYKNKILVQYHNGLIDSLKLSYMKMPNECRNSFKIYLNEKSKPKETSNLDLARTRYYDCISLYKPK